MRELKFRAVIYSINLKNVTIIYSDEYPCLADFWDEMHDSGVDYYEQFISLYDAHGREIYEGDIAKVKSKSYGIYLSVVRYRENQAGFVVHNYPNIQLEMPEREWDRKHYPCNCDGAMYEGWRLLHVSEGYPTPRAPIEIIGNIHENPDLLEE
jgi:uncharacterized phage protein (TIGR01671 family)